MRFKKPPARWLGMGRGVLERTERRAWEALRLERELKVADMVADMALIWVLAVVIGAAMYLIVSGTAAGKVQLDPYNSKAFGTTARIVLKFGESARSINSIQILDVTGANIVSGTCTMPSPPFRAGYSYEITCTLTQPPSGRVVVRVDYTAGDGSRKVADLEWVLG